MKKIYNAPTTKTVVISVNKNVLTTTSIAVGTQSVNGSAALGREDNSWDIWGNNDLDEE